MLSNAIVVLNADGAGGGNIVADVGVNGVDDKNGCIDGAGNGAAGVALMIL